MGILRDMKSIKEKLMARGKEWASGYYKSKFHRQWRTFIFQGRKLNTLTMNSKGNLMKNRASCLVDRLEKYDEDFLRFFHDFHVPFDNKQVERDVRQFKIKLKIAGCFRTLEVVQDSQR